MAICLSPSFHSTARPSHPTRLLMRQLSLCLIVAVVLLASFSCARQLEELPAETIVPGDFGSHCQQCAARNSIDSPGSKVCSEAFENEPGQFCGYWSEHPLQNLRRPCCCGNGMICQLESISCKCVSRSPIPTTPAPSAVRHASTRQLQDKNADQTGILAGILVGTLAPCLACCMCVHCLCRRKTQAAAPQIVKPKPKKPYSPPAYVAGSEETRPADQTDRGLVV